MSWYEWRAGELVLHVRVQARARDDGVDGLYGDRLKIRVRAPPAEGRANQAVSALLAAAFKVPAPAVRLVRGQHNRNKTFAVRAPGELPDWFRSLGGA